MRSLLFAGATRPDLIAKLPRSGPTAVCIDLEDAVPASHKEEARATARELGARLAREHPGLEVFVRVNARRSEWFAGDLDGGLAPALAGIVVPKVDSAADVEHTRRALLDKDLGQLRVLAGIETVRGVLAADEVLAAGIEAAYFGAEDYVTDLGGRRTAESLEVLYARSRVALLARANGVVAIDIASVAIRDPDAYRAEAEAGRALGYRGKICLHPDQVTIANEIFGHRGEEVTHARQMLAAAGEAGRRGVGALVFEGVMIDEPALQMARRTLAEAAEADSSTGTDRAKERPAS